MRRVHCVAPSRARRAYAAGAAWAVDPTQLPDPALQARYLALTHELRCMQCQNESLADSPVELAADLRREVRDMLLAGKSDEQVRAFMAARYGDFILFRPRFAAETAWLWVAPPLLLLIGALVAWRVVRKRAGAAPRGRCPLRRGPEMLMLTFVLLAAALTLAVVAVVVPLLRRGPAATTPAPWAALAAGAVLVIGVGGSLRPGATGPGRLPRPRIPRSRWWRASRAAWSAIRRSQRLADARTLLRRAAGVPLGRARVRRPTS